MARNKNGNRYRLPGIEREGIAQLSLLETAMWPLQGGETETNSFRTKFEYTIEKTRREAEVTVRAPLGLQTSDELVLWGLLGATLKRADAEPALMATPYWMLKHLGLATGGSQYADLRDSLLRLSVASYHNTAFYNPTNREREFAAFQFLSILLPTVGGVGETIDNDRCWRVEWNPIFFRFCQATGGNLLFDIDIYRQLTPAARRLFLKLKDRFWRSKEVFLNVDDLTIHGLGFAASRPLFKRKFDLTSCLRELLTHEIISLLPSETDVKDLIKKRGKGSYVVVLREGDYFRQSESSRVLRQKNAISNDPLLEPLLKVGVNEAAVRRIFADFTRNQIQRWLRITDAAMHEQPRGFAGFKVSPAAFLLDGIQNNRMPPDWWHSHEERVEHRSWESSQPSHTPTDNELQQRYEEVRSSQLSSISPVQWLLMITNARASTPKTCAKNFSRS